MSNKFNNCVIEVLTKEHGEQVIEWWQEQGVDTKGYEGTLCKADGDASRYYGLYKGCFGNYSVIYGLKVLKLPEQFSCGWCIKSCEELIHWQKVTMQNSCNWSLNDPTGYYSLRSEQDLTIWRYEDTPPENKRLITFEEFLLITKQKTNSYVKQQTSSESIKVLRPTPTITRSNRPSGSAIQGRRSKVATTRRHSCNKAISC